MKSVLFNLLSLAAFVPVAFAAEYLVGVGKDETTGRKGLGFDPSVINPTSGDVIVFEFRSGQHSVVQSSFDNPCVGNGGFDSGVQNVSDDLAVDAPGLPTIRLPVNNTDPIWFFDEAGGLCSKGAVLAVNPSITQTAAAFKGNAARPVQVPSFTTAASSTLAGSTTASTDASASAAANKTSGSGINTDTFNYVTLLAGIIISGILAVF